MVLFSKKMTTSNSAEMWLVIAISFICLFVSVTYLGSKHTLKKKVYVYVHIYIHTHVYMYVYTHEHTQWGLKILLVS